MNVCRSCREDFTSVEAFDEHRVGSHTEPGDRRCRTTSELTQLGWARNQSGRWVHPRQRRRLAHTTGYPPHDTRPDPTPTGQSLTETRAHHVAITAPTDGPR